MLSVIDEYLSEHVTNVQLEYFHIELDELRVYFFSLKCVLRSSARSNDRLVNEVWEHRGDQYNVFLVQVCPTCPFVLV